MKITENDFGLDIRPIIFAFAAILQLFGTFETISFLTPSKTGFIFGLIPLVLQKLTIPHMKASILSCFEPEEQVCGINIGAPCPFFHKKYTF